MFVNIAHKKTFGACSRVYEGEEYDIYGLRKMLQRKFNNENNDINANLYWFTASLLADNGYGYYVDLLHNEATKSIRLGILGLVALCCYDISFMHKTFFGRFTKQVLCQDYNLIYMNSESVYYSIITSEAINAIKTFNDFASHINQYKSMLNIVKNFIMTDIDDEENIIYTHKINIYDDVVDEPYLIEKREYIDKQYNKAIKKLIWWQNYINGAIIYYEAKINDCIENESNYLVVSIFDYCYNCPALFGYIRKNLNSRQINEFAKRLVSLNVIHNIEINDLLPKLIKNYNEDHIKNSNIAITKKLYVFKVNKIDIIMFIKDNIDEQVRVIASWYGAPITWCKQCGYWGQWIFTYSENDGILQKWAVHEVYDSEAHETNFEILRMWRINIEKNINEIIISDKYIILTKHSEIKVYSIDYFSHIEALAFSLPELKEVRQIKKLRKYT